MSFAERLRKEQEEINELLPKIDHRETPRPVAEPVVEIQEKES